MSARHGQPGVRKRAAPISLAIASLIAAMAVRTVLAASEAESDVGAQDMGSNNLDEVVVTAQKRTEKLIDVPMSVTAISGESLQQEGAVSYGDYLPSVPGVAYAKTGFLDKIFIRGLADAMSSQANSTTGIYLDEANITESTASIGDVGTFDIARVEVLRGPQGTLYGDSSMGGTVRIITNKPDLNKFSAIVDASGSDTEHGGLNGDGNFVLNAPIIDGVLGVRLAAGYSYNDGFINNIATGQEDINTVTTKRVRFLTEYDPLDNLHMLLSYNYVDSIQNYGPFEDRRLPKYDVSRLYPESSDYRMNLVGLTVNYDFSWATLVSATNYLKKFNEYIRDFTNNYLSSIQPLYPNLPSNTGVGLTFSFPNTLFTEEVRLSSTTQGPFHWLVGGYYSDFHPPVGSQQFLTTSPITQGVDLGTNYQYLRTREIAGFGEVTWSATDRLDLTAGARQFHFVVQDTSGADGPLNGGYTPPLRQSSGEASHVLKFRVSYKLSPDHLLYTQASQGFRPGGPAGPFSSEDTADLAALGFKSAPTQYTSDKVWDYEIGSKNEFLNGLFSVSGDLYYIDWTNTQIALNLDDGTQLISNAGKATSKGAELETAAHPIKGLDLQASAAYTDATFNQTFPAIQTLAGAQLPNVPKWTWSFSGTYHRPVAEGVVGYLRGDLAHVSARINDLAGKPAASLFLEPQYTTLNLRAGASFSGWDTALFVKNVTDTQAIYNIRSSSPYWETFSTPRTIGLEVRKEF
jgi:outer membrane receptor protein involved in Fe transport